MAREVQRNRERRSRGGSLKQLPWRQYRNPYRPIEVLTEEQLEAVHLASLKILEDFGMEFLDAGARDRLRAAGARVDKDGLRVRFDRGFILEHIAKVPSEVTLHARNPERSLIFGGNYINFGSVASAPNCSDMDKGRRPGSFEDYCNLLRLCQSLNIVHFIAGYPVEPADLPASNSESLAGLDTELSCVKTAVFRKRVG